MNIVCITLHIKLTQLFSPGCGGIRIHSTRLRKIVKIYRFVLNFWAVKADIEREDGLSVSLSNGVMKGVSLLFVSYGNVISTQHNLQNSSFQAKL